MKYVLNRRFRLRGWYKAPTGLFDTDTKRTEFFVKNLYTLLLKCDGAHDIDEDAFSEEERAFFEQLKEKGIIHPAGLLEYLEADQAYRIYPARYRAHVHWSITGACNLKCRHCFMSAPHARHGSPTKEQLLAIADQLAECGIFTVGLTGGEPLIREDLWELIDALSEREIGVSIIYTNGWLVDEGLLDKLEGRNMHPNFQLSFDGLGWHDFLRGVPGAEKKTIAALKLLQERNYNVSVSMCLHRKSRGTLRETVKLLASLGVKSVKCGGMMALGEWTNPEVHDLQMTRREELEMMETYIPQYFADDAPLSIMLEDTLMYTPGDDAWEIYNVRRVSAEEEEYVPSCGLLKDNFYIGAEGMVAPCMGMGDCGFAERFPNLFETPLREILREGEFIDLTGATVKDIRDHNPKCRECAYVDRCTGGCRNSVLMQGDDYFGIDKDVCYFFENGWEERLTRAAEKPFADYLKRNPPKTNEKPENEGLADCP